MGVLVVDDSATTLAVIKSMLAEIGVRQTYTAKDGREALDFVGSCEDMVDFILCDWHMPRMSCLDLLRQVRSTADDLPFLMITTSADIDSVAEAISCGVSGYLKKPFSAAQLQRKLEILALPNGRNAILDALMVRC